MIIRKLQVITFLCLFVGLSGKLLAAVDSPTRQVVPPSPGAVTFSSHIAEIIHTRCAGCHHEGQTAPFNLLTYQDVRKRAQQILDMVESGAMPPWLPAHGYGEFINERRVTEEELTLLRQWVADGAREGDPRAMPPLPTWKSGWQHGIPDLVVTMDQPFELGAEGPDLYRNFAIRLPLESDRLVRAVEFSPGNPRIVHHAFIRVDEEGQAFQLDGKDGQPGFTNMYSWARMPGGQFLTWNPGSPPVVSLPGLAWPLKKNSDLVVEMHLNRTGKPETIQASVGFYFTDEQPTNTCHTFKLGSYALNFPAGSSNVVVRDSMVLPVDVDVLGIYPHAHFLAREMQGYAILPDGVKEWLFWIKQWDFNWQGSYRYARPIHFPKGTTLHLHYTYDNSTNNLVNPNQPPQRVEYGEQSSDEMCELGIQVLTAHQNDLKTLEYAGDQHRSKMNENALRQRIAFNRNDAEALTGLGMMLWVQNRLAEASNCLDRAIKEQPDFAQAHFNRGVFLRFNGQPAEARREFETALRLDEQFPKAHQQLAFTMAALGRAADAEHNFQKALELDPSDPVARKGLNELRQFFKSRSPAKESD